jgi:hypothetical protein
MSSKKSHRIKVRVKSRQALVQQNHQVRFPTETSREIIHQVAEPGDDDEQPVGLLPLGLTIMNEPDDQRVLHIDDLLDDMDDDGCLDPNDDNGEYLDMSEWEEE